MRPASVRLPFEFYSRRPVDEANLALGPSVNRYLVFKWQKSMITLGNFLKMFAIVFVLAVIFESISRVTYYGNSPRSVLHGFRSVLIRCLILTSIFMISTVVWSEMGWLPKHR